MIEIIGLTLLTVLIVLISTFVILTIIILAVPIVSHLAEIWVDKVDDFFIELEERKK